MRAADIRRAMKNGVPLAWDTPYRQRQKVLVEQESPRNPGTWMCVDAITREPCIFHVYVHRWARGRSSREIPSRALLGEWGEVMERAVKDETARRETQERDRLRKEQELGVVNAVASRIRGTSLGVDVEVDVVEEHAERAHIRVWVKRESR